MKAPLSVLRKAVREHGYAYGAGIIVGAGVALALRPFLRAHLIAFFRRMEGF